MKTEDLVMIVGAAVAVYVIARMVKPAAAGQGATTASGSGVVSSDAGFGKLITTWNGWRYYDTGYAKDQFGNIYFQGEKIADAVWGAV